MGNTTVLLYRLLNLYCVHNLHNIIIFRCVKSLHQHWEATYPHCDENGKCGLCSLCQCIEGSFLKSRAGLGGDDRTILLRFLVNS